MANRMMGMETEYALSVMGAKAASMAGHPVAQILIEIARKKLRHLNTGNPRDLFLQNGGRFYVDCDTHPEMSTPECVNPWDVVRYSRAGDALLAGLLPEVVRAIPKAREAFLFRCNVDYSGAYSTWGCHESYLHRCPGDISADLVPHLVSRVIYAGAGGFNPFAAGLEFSIFPRAFHLTTAVSGGSTHDRPIYHTREEPLASKGYRRLHIISGENLASDTATWLKVASTALVVAMTEAGVKPGALVPLANPVAAIREFARDPFCRATVRLSDDSPRTALEIQWHYLALAEARVDEPYMPPWAAKAVETWRSVLRRLEEGPDSVSTQLDWAMKRTLYMDHVRRRGLDWETIEGWNQRLPKRIVRRPQRPRTYREMALRSQGLPTVEEAAEPESQNGNLSEDEQAQLKSIRNELFEIDLRFSQVGERSIFSQLDRAGLLDHRFPGVDNIEHAMENPPSSGRAHVRGSIIRKEGVAERNRFTCSWDRVVDTGNNRILDLSDPFNVVPEWKAFEPLKTPPSIFF